jgi:hypothetical protein
MAPPRHDNHVNDYIDNFIAYTHRINLASEQHQVSLFVQGLRQELREAVVCHLPRSKETAVNLACSLDDKTAIHATATPTSVPGQQRQRDTQEDRAPKPPLTTLAMTTTRQAHAPRNGYTSLADLKARRQQQETVTSASSASLDPRTLHTPSATSSFSYAWLVGMNVNCKSFTTPPQFTQQL